MRVMVISLLFSLVFTPTLSLGTEVDIYKSRNPFLFGTSKSMPGIKKGGQGKKTGDTEIKVGLIMIIGGKKIAIINGKRYKVGDKLAEYIIKSISLNYVELDSAEGLKKVYVNENFR